MTKTGAQQTQTKAPIENKEAIIKNLLDVEALLRCLAALDPTRDNNPDKVADSLPAEIADCLPAAITIAADRILSIAQEME